MRNATPQVKYHPRGLGAPGGGGETRRRVEPAEDRSVPVPEKKKVTFFKKDILYRYRSTLQPERS
jgi:hypothetical protein